MTPKEFEDLTGIYPDRILYGVAEREYERRDENGHDVWDDKAQFCHAYKFNEDGLAERIQAAANEAIWQMEERHRKALNESGERVRKLYEQNAQLEAEVEALHAKLEAATEHEQDLRAKLDTALAALLVDRVTIRRARHYAAIVDMVCDDATAEEVLHAVYAYIRDDDIDDETKEGGGET